MIVLCVAAGVGLWYLIRKVWRSLVREKPESKFVERGLAMSPVARKIVAAIPCVLLSFCLIGSFTSGATDKSSEPSDVSAETVAVTTQEAATTVAPSTTEPATTDVAATTAAATVEVESDQQADAAEQEEQATDNLSSEDTAVSSEEKQQSYVLNTNTMKFHTPSCSSVSRMKDGNRQDFTGTRQEVIDMGYSPCGKCHP